MGIGLCGVFELIKETRQSHPTLCSRALQALLDMLQGQSPEGLKTEPPDVIGIVYTFSLSNVQQGNFNFMIGKLQTN